MLVQKNVSAWLVVMFVSTLFKIIFFEKDKDGNMQIINGGPYGCSLHKDSDHQMIVESYGYCPDFHCRNATEENEYKWVVKETTDDDEIMD